MRCRTAVTLFVMALTAPRTPGQSAHFAPAARAAFDDGCRLALQGKDGRAAFRRAAHELGKQANHHPSPQAYLNLGNAAFLADDLPRAIAAFRQGLALAPQHARLREHLEYARVQAALPHGGKGQPEADPWPWWLPRWSSCVWLALAVSAHVAACGALAGWWIHRRRAWLWTASVALGLALLAGYAWSIGCLERQRDLEMPVVVIRAEAATLHTGNGRSYPSNTDLPRLHAGMEARQRSERGGWLQIEFADGPIGWVESGDVIAPGF